MPRASFTYVRFDSYLAIFMNGSFHLLMNMSGFKVWKIKKKTITEYRNNAHFDFWRAFVPKIDMVIAVNGAD